MVGGENQLGEGMRRGEWGYTELDFCFLLSGGIVLL